MTRTAARPHHRKRRPKTRFRGFDWLAAVIRWLGFDQNQTFWIAAAFLSIAFVFGGGSRSDISGLMLLRPLSVMACGYGFSRWSVDDWKTHRILLGLFGAMFALIVLHLVPLPPTCWHALPGRTIVVDIDAALGQPGLWRPLTLAPEPAINALFSLFVPLAMLALYPTLTPQGREALLPMLIGFGLISGLLFVMQTLAPGSRAPVLYGLVDNMAVGLFANRNHAAIYLAILFPMLAVYATMGPRRTRRIPLRTTVSALIGSVVIPLILVMGSRNGLLTGFAGLLFVLPLIAPALLRRRFHRATRPGWQPYALVAIIGVLLAAGLAAATIALARGLALERLLIGVDTDQRLLFWSESWRATQRYFPFGSGAGSFVEAYKVGEPITNLSPNYANHAHNDWLELVMTFGLPGIIFLLVIVALWVAGSWRAWRVLPTDAEQTALARLASVGLLLLALASIADYPLRVPSLMCLAVILVVWLRGQPGALDSAGHSDGANGSGRSTSVSLVVK